MAPKLRPFHQGIPPETIWGVKRNYEELLPKTVRCSTASATGTVLKLLRSETFGRFAEVISGRRVRPRWGTQVLEHRFAKRMLTSERRDKIAGYFDKYGAWIIFIGRFLPGLRAPLFLTAGTMKVSFWTFCGMNGTAAAISVPASFGLAYYFTNQLEKVLAVRDSVQYWAFGGLAILVVSGLLVKRWWTRRQASQATASQAGESMTTTPPKS